MRNVRIAAALVGIACLVVSQASATASKQVSPRFPAGSNLRLALLGGKVPGTLALWGIGPKRSPIFLGSFAGEVSGRESRVVELGHYSSASEILLWHEWTPEKGVERTTGISTDPQAYLVKLDPRGGYRVTIPRPGETDPKATPLVHFWLFSTPDDYEPGMNQTTNGTKAPEKTNEAAILSAAGCEFKGPDPTPVPAKTAKKTNVDIAVPGPLVRVSQTTKIGTSILDLRFFLAILSFLVSGLLFVLWMKRQGRPSESPEPAYLQHLEEYVRLGEPEPATLEQADSNEDPKLGAHACAFKALVLSRQGLDEEAHQVLRSIDLSLLPKSLLERLGQEIKIDTLLFEQTVARQSSTDHSGKTPPDQSLTASAPFGLPRLLSVSGPDRTDRMAPPISVDRQETETPHVRVDREPCSLPGLDEDNGSMELVSPALLSVARSCPETHPSNLDQFSPSSIKEWDLTPSLPQDETARKEGQDPQGPGVSSLVAVGGAWLGTRLLDFRRLSASPLRTLKLISAIPQSKAADETSNLAAIGDSWVGNHLSDLGRISALPLKVRSLLATLLSERPPLLQGQATEGTEAVVLAPSALDPAEAPAGSTSISDPEIPVESSSDPTSHCESAAKGGPTESPQEIPRAESFPDDGMTKNVASRDSTEPPKPPSRSDENDEPVSRQETTRANAGTTPPNATQAGIVAESNRERVPQQKGFLMSLALEKSEAKGLSKWLEHVNGQSLAPLHQEHWVRNQMALSSLTRLTSRIPPHVSGADLNHSSPFVAVFSGRQRDRGRRVHVWMLSPILATAPEVAEEYLRQARYFSDLAHPEIYHVYEAYSNPHPCFITEAFEGESLAAVLEAKGALPLHEVLRIASGVARALDFCHQRGFVHQDVHPGTVFVTAEEVRLGPPILPSIPVDELRSMSGELPPRARYLPPEILEGNAPDYSTDIFQVGMLIYEALTGIRPDASCLPGAPYWEVPSSITPGIPQELDHLVTRSLNPNPVRRFRDIGLVAQVLAELEKEHGSTDRVGLQLLKTLRVISEGPLKKMATHLERLIQYCVETTSPGTGFPVRFDFRPIRDILVGPGGLIQSLATTAEMSVQFGQKPEVILLKTVAQQCGTLVPLLVGLSKLGASGLPMTHETVQRCARDFIELQQLISCLQDGIRHIMKETRLEYRSLVERVVSESDLNCDISNVTESAASHFAQPAEVREVIENVFRTLFKQAKSQGATQVTVIGEPDEDEEMVRLFICDNGSSVSPQENDSTADPTHQRISVIRRRISEIGGNVSLSRNSKQGGTRVRLTLPGVI